MERQLLQQVLVTNEKQCTVGPEASGVQENSGTQVARRRREREKQVQEGAELAMTPEQRRINQHGWER